MGSKVCRHGGIIPGNGVRSGGGGIARKQYRRWGMWAGHMESVYVKSDSTIGLSPCLHVVLRLSIKIILFLVDWPGG